MHGFLLDAWSVRQRTRWGIIGLVALCLLVMAAPAASRPAATHTVCSSGCDFTTIQAAVNAADHGDTVQLLITSPHTEYDIVVNKSVSIEGLGETNTIVQAAAAAGIAPNRVFFVVDGLDVQIKEMTIRYGDAPSTGGGLHNAGSDVTLTQVHIRSNEAANGGGIYSTGGTLTLTDVLVIDNSIGGDGGGIYNAGTLIMEASEVTANENFARGAGIFTSGTAIIQDSVISSNNVLFSSEIYLQGGGIYNEGTLHVVNSNIRYNEMAGEIINGTFNGGGGIYSSQGEFHLIDSVVEYNRVGSDLDGGGLYLLSNDTTIRRSVINNNRADGGFSRTGGLYMYSGILSMRDTSVRSNQGDVGGGMSLTLGTVDIRHTTIHSNESNAGGGVYVCGNQTTMALNNVTISDNDAIFDGGGIYICSTGELFLANVTITNNRADSDDEGNGDGGGVYLDTFNQNSGVVHLKNTILGDNDDLSDWPSTAAYDCFGEVTSEGYNIISDLGFEYMAPTPCQVSGTPTGNLIGEPAMLDILADNGGPTLTHSFLPGSPALNTGDPAGCTDFLGSPLLTDQRHGFRLDRCDKGSYEAGALVKHLHLPLMVKD